MFSKVLFYKFKKDFLQKKYLIFLFFVCCISIFWGIITSILAKSNFHKYIAGRGGTLQYTAYSLIVIMIITIVIFLFTIMNSIKYFFTDIEEKEILIEYRNGQTPFASFMQRIITQGLLTYLLFIFHVFIQLLFYFINYNKENFLVYKFTIGTLIYTFVAVNIMFFVCSFLSIISGEKISSIFSSLFLIFILFGSVFFSSLIKYKDGDISNIDAQISFISNYYDWKVYNSLKDNTDMKKALAKSDDYKEFDENKPIDVSNIDNAIVNIDPNDYRGIYKAIEPLNIKWMSTPLYILRYVDQFTDCGYKLPFSNSVLFEDAKSNIQAKNYEYFNYFIFNLLKNSSLRIEELKESDLKNIINLYNKEKLNIKLNLFNNLSLLLYGISPSEPILNSFINVGGTPVCNQDINIIYNFSGNILQSYDIKVNYTGYIVSPILYFLICNPLIISFYPIFKRRAKK
ncbi:hypothetical protein [Spiroplasma endosymbiont of Aspidapion aeneum]|uniref:hypothetical protein n=1 Tax=Spiroplasma endosymbiont of Aspidapion aeneum TaxID=3066276 RepID=UPI00313C12F0